MCSVKRVASICAIVTVVLIAIVAKLFVDAGQFRQLPVADQKWRCTRVVAAGKLTDMPGLEDAVVLKQWILFSSDNRDTWMGNRSKLAELTASQQGAIFAVLEPTSRRLDTEAHRMTLINYPHADFHPHGLGLWNPRDGTKPRLFVVNHQRHVDCVDIFDIDLAARTLTWVVSVQSNYIFELNDVVPASRSTFFATNYLHYPMGTFANAVEVFGQRPWGSLVFCRFEPREIDCHLAYDGLRMPNGIALSADARHVFVSGGTDKSLLVFRRAESKYAEETKQVPLEPICYVPLGASPDNLELERAGSLLVTSHLKALTFLQHAVDHSSPAPSLVQRVTWTDANQFAAAERSLDQQCMASVSTVFASTGETNSSTDLPAASIAVRPGKRRLVIGSVFVQGYLSCVPI